MIDLLFQCKKILVLYWQCTVPTEQEGREREEFQSSSVSSPDSIGSADPDWESGPGSTQVEISP
jgi:hypothetical protein